MGCIAAAVMMESSGREKAAVSDSLEQTLRQQINTLTVALATLTEEKSKMETSFQADKRSLLAQQDSLNKQLQVSECYPASCVVKAGFCGKSSLYM